MKKKLISEGTKICDWTVLRYIETVDKIDFYECQCICGNISKVRGYNLKSKRSKGCITCGKKRTRQSLIGKDRSKYDPINYTLKRIYKDYRYRAKKKNQIFGLSFKYFVLLTSKNCFYCNIPPSKITNRTNQSGVLEIRQERYDAGWVKYNGIDRVDSSKGYIENNVVPCCSQCNKAKLDSSVEEFQEWIKRVYTHFINK